MKREYTDMMGQSLAVGDHVAYPTNQGWGMCVARIEEILDGAHPSPWSNEGWHAKLSPLYRSNKRITETSPKQVTVGNVCNFVKVVPPSGEEG